MNLNLRRFKPWHKHRWRTMVNPLTHEVWMECSCGEKVVPWRDELEVDVMEDEDGTLVRVLWTAETLEALEFFLEEAGSVRG